MKKGIISSLKEVYVGITEDITIFEKNLNDLIIRYEHYFLGLEKREPLKQLEEVERLSRKYIGSDIINTMLTFKYNALKARLVSYKQYWHRTMRLIEEGKYSRDRFKMEIHSQAASPDLEVRETDKTDEMETIFRQFVQARKECNLPVDSVSREKVAEIVEKHKRAALEKYRCSDVELRIAVENGNLKLKIRPKK
jgi:hypothetical protein